MQRFFAKNLEPYIYRLYLHDCTIGKKCIKHILDITILSIPIERANRRFKCEFIYFQFSKYTKSN